MTTLLGRDANRIPCGRCCRQPVRVRPTDDQMLPTEKCPDELGAKLGPDDLAADGVRKLLQREDGYCVHLAPDLTHCLLVTETADRRPFACRDGWPDELCADLDCPKLEKNTE